MASTSAISAADTLHQTAVALTPTTVANLRAPNDAAIETPIDVTVAQGIAQIDAEAPATEDSAGGEGNNKRRRGRRGGRRRRRGSEAGQGNETGIESEDALDEVLDTDAAQPEFDFDDIERPATCLLYTSRCV